MNRHIKAFFDTDAAALRRLEALFESAQAALDEMEAELAAVRMHRALLGVQEEKLTRDRDAAHAALSHLRSALAMMKEGQA